MFGPTFFFWKSSMKRPAGKFLDGEIGSLVITPLYINSMTPFLRWCSGDLVASRCPKAMAVGRYFRS